MIDTGFPLNVFGLNSFRYDWIGFSISSFPSCTRRPENHKIQKKMKQNAFFIFAPWKKKDACCNIVILQETSRAIVKFRVN